MARPLAAIFTLTAFTAFGLGLAACAQAASRGNNLTLLTWNMEWLITPEADRAMRPLCQRQQPASNEHALPCTPGRAPPPQRQSADFDAMAKVANSLLREHQVDVVALQEVDGAAAAKTVFRQGWSLDCFVKRAHPQKVGFAIREGIPYRCNGELIALDRDATSRAGADISLWPGTPQEVRLLAVHLKSGCFDGKLDRHFAPCAQLRSQVPVLEQWVDARVREGTAFAVMGDFNRHLDKDSQYPAGPDESAPFNLMAALSDNQPPGAVLVRAAENAAYKACNAQDTHSRYIDDVLLSQRLVNQARNKQFVRIAYPPEDSGRLMSDHCPLGIKLDGLSP